MRIFFMVCIVTLLISGCSVPGFTEAVDVKPADFNINSLRERLIGLTKTEVEDKLGSPAFEYQREGENYFIYQELGEVYQFMYGEMGGFLRSYPRYCINMQFDEDNVLQELEPISCKTIQDLQLEALRKEAKQGIVDSAAVLYVHHGETAFLEELSNTKEEARIALFLIYHGRSFEHILLGGLSDAELSERAIEGNPEAAYQLYFNYSAPVSYMWLCRAADLGHLEARHRLGVLYENGAEGFKKDPLQAYRWYSLAAEIGSYEAWRRVRDLRKDGLTTDEAAQIDALVKSWKVGECEKDVAR